MSLTVSGAKHSRFAQELIHRQQESTFHGFAGALHQEDLRMNIQLITISKTSLKIATVNALHRFLNVAHLEKSLYGMKGMEQEHVKHSSQRRKTPALK